MLRRIVISTAIVIQTRMILMVRMSMRMAMMVINRGLGIPLSPRIIWYVKMSSMTSFQVEGVFFCLLVVESVF